MSETAKQAKDAKRELPDGWRWVKLGDLGPIIDGDWILNADYSESGVRLLQVGDVGCGQFVGKSSRFISANRATELRCTLLQAGDILISRMPDPIGRACILPDLGYPCITAVDVSIWRLHGRGTIADILVAYLNTEEWYHRVLNQASGATRPRISRTKLQELEIPLPPLPEQQRIAGVLKKQMALIGKARAAAQVRLAAVKALPAAFLRQIFPQSGQPLPDGWHWVKLGKLCELNPRRPLIDRKDSDPTSFIPMEAVDAISGLVSDLRVRPYGTVKKGYTYFSEGDVLFAKITPCMQNGKHTIAKDLIGEIGFGTTEFHVLRPNENIIPELLWFFIRQPNVLIEATEHFTGAVGQQRLPEDYLANLELPLPPIAEQPRIAGALKEQMVAVEKARAAADQELNTINALPAILMRRAFNGEI